MTNPEKISPSTSPQPQASYDEMVGRLQQAKARIVELERLLRPYLARDRLVRRARGERGKGAGPAV